jgi:N-acyl-L-homoserine lactone synthetase
VDSPTEPIPQWFDTADELARTLLEAARPVRFAVARTPHEMESVFRLRYRVTVERGWREPEEMPDGLERDEYDDEAAVQIAGWDGTTLAGCARVVYPAAGRPLPTEAAFGIVAEPAGRVADAARLIVSPEYRGREHRVLGGLAASIWTAMAHRGYRWVAVAISPPMVELSRALGFDVSVLGPARPYWGEERMPALMSAPDPRAWR